MFQKNCLRYSPFSSPNLRIICGFSMREDGAELFPDIALRKSLSLRSTKGCDISACLHVAPGVSDCCKSSHRTRNIQDRHPIEVEPAPFHVYPSKITYHPCAQTSHIGAYLLGIAGYNNTSP